MMVWDESSFLPSAQHQPGLSQKLILIPYLSRSHTHHNKSMHADKFTRRMRQRQRQRERGEETLFDWHEKLLF